MKTRHFFAALTALLAYPVGGVWLAQTPSSYEGLLKVKSRRFDIAYLLPGADFQHYIKVIIDAPEVAFKKNWLRDYNRSSIELALSH